MVGGGKVVVVVVVMMMNVVLGLYVPSSSASNINQQQKWWKWMSSGKRGGPGASSSSSAVVKPVASSVVYPLYGNVYPDGYYYVQINIGQPPKPYFLDPDTGSDLTWLQCDAPCVHCTRAPHPFYKPTNDLVICKDPLCASLHSPDYRCDNLEQCDYDVEYADGGSSIGVLVIDEFPLNFTSGTRLNPRLALGCGYDQNPGASHHPLDGVLGLGKGKSSIVSQLHKQGLIQNVVGHCLSVRGGFLFFGGDVYDSSHVMWTPMLRDDSKHYSTGHAELVLGGKTTAIKNLLVVFDSGSSYTYLNSQAYGAVLSSVKNDLDGKLKEAVDDQTLPLCWRGRKPFKSVRDVRKYFKHIALSFSNGQTRKSQFDITPEGFLIISSKGNVCLGILNGTEVGLQSINLVGDISMQDKMVIYDSENQTIGWVPANCDRPLKSNAIM